MRADENPERTMKRGVAALLGACLLFWAMSASAADVVATSRDSIQIDMNKGALVRLSRAAASIFVANPEIADVQVKSPRLVYVLAKKPGETVLYAVDEDDRVLTNQRITVTHNLGQLRDSIRRLIPGAPIEVNSIDGAIVLRGAAANGAQADDARRLARRLVREDDQVVNAIHVVEPNQINLRVRIAEVARSVLKVFGVNWDAATVLGDNFSVGIAQGSNVIVPDSDGLLNLFGGPIQVRNANTNSFFGSFVDSKNGINTLLDALDSEGLVTILAEPNLTAVSGKSATFLAGGEFPIPVTQEPGVVSITYRQFGVSLAFTPTIIGANRISLNVNPEVSQLSNTGAVSVAGFNVPSLSTRRATTTVELASGQSFAIAGLIQNGVTHDLSKFPGLGDIPVLGTLFRSNRFQRNESELVIVVTPYVVRPVDASTRLALPTDGLIHSNDADRLLLGHARRVNLERRRPSVVGQGGQGLVGPAGFVLD
jgi:pilus assembly protein CpaC